MRKLTALTVVYSLKEFLRHAQYRTVLSSEFKDIFEVATKNSQTTMGCTVYSGNKEMIFFQPILMNDRAKELHGSGNNRTSIPEK